MSFESDPEGWLKETIVAPDKKLAFFVGAGISRGSGLPDFFNFSKNFIGSICPDDLDANYIEEICKRLRPEVLLQVVQQIHKDRTLEFYKSLESDLPNANHFFLALALKMGHCVFTTNVDTLIEKACQKIKLPCISIVHEEEYEHFLEKQSKNDSGIDFKSQLFKLHGSIESDKIGLKKYESIRFILDRVGLGLTDYQEKVFSECLQDYDFIFLGYSGNDHFSVLPVLLKVDSDQKIYWFKFEREYVFSWNKIPGKDNGRLIKFLTQKLGIDWAETAKIEKIDVDKTIKVSAEEKILLLKLNENKTKVVLVIDGNESNEFIAKMESDELNIYERDKTKPEFNQGIGYFRNRKEHLLDKALDGTSSVVDWEEISILEILSKREQSILARCNSSHIVEESLGMIIHLNDDPEVKEINNHLKKLPSGKIPEPEFIEPTWVKTITEFERHLLAATLLIRMRDLTDFTEIQLKQAENYARDDREKSEAEKLRASTFSITRRLGNIKSSNEDLVKAINRLEGQGDFVSVAEAYLELANILRIDRKFESAKETLNKAENVLKTNKSKFQEQRRAYDWPRLMAHMFLLRGLLFGLGQKGTIADKIDAIKYCDEAYNFAYQAGDVARRAAALNARGLIIYQLAERSNSLLQEAEISLDNSLALHARIGDPNTSFKPLRNRLLIQLLRTKGSKLLARGYWLNESQIDCNRARNYLNQMKGIDSGESSADMIEINYRQAQIFGLKGDKGAARNLFKKVLAYWEERNNLHQQARIWQDLLSLADKWDEYLDCICPLLAIIESLFQSEKEREHYRNDLLRLENIRDMLIDAYMKVNEHKDQEYISKIVSLMDQGRKIAENLDEEYLSQDFKIWSSEYQE